MREAGHRFGRTIGLSPPLVARMFERFERQIGIAVDQLAAHLHLSALGVPALVVHDVEDEDVPWEEGERYARLWPGARLLSTRGLGHHLTYSVSRYTSSMSLTSVPTSSAVM